MKKVISLFIFSALLSFAASPAYPLMIGLSTEELVRDADVIVTGRVSDVVSFWNEDASVILSQARIEITDNLKGDAAGFVTVEYKGGVVGNLEMRESDTPVFAEGEEVIVFLKAQDTTHGRLQRSVGSANIYRIVGRAQGKYTVTEDGFASKTGFCVTEETEALVQRRVDSIQLINMIKEMADEN